MYLHWKQTWSSCDLQFHEPVFYKFMHVIFSLFVNGSDNFFIECAKRKKNFNVVSFVSHGIFKFKDAKIQEQLSY